MAKLKPCFVDQIPETLEDGIIYVSELYETSIHLCPCGCKSEVVLPFGNHKLHWKYSRTDDLVSFNPSVGNFNFPCKTHYFIKNNEILFV